MATFIMLTRLAHGAIRSPEQLEKLENEVMKRIEEGLAGGQVKWLANYAVLGEPKTFIHSASDDRRAERLPRFGFRETG